VSDVPSTRRYSQEEWNRLTHAQRTAVIESRNKSRDVGGRGASRRGTQYGRSGCVVEEEVVEQVAAIEVMGDLVDEAIHIVVMVVVLFLVVHQTTRISRIEGKQQVEH